VRAIVVRRRRGRLRHGISEGAESPRETLCGRNADGMVLDSRGINCPICRREIERLGWSEVRGR